MTSTILVVDDEVTAREGLRLTLEAEGYQVREAPSGKDALEQLRTFAFDLVITDLKMPGMTGLELLAEVRRVRPETDVIIITGFATVDTAISAMKSGAFDYLTKPFNLDVVRQSVRRALEKRRLVAENVGLRKELSRLGGLDQIVGSSPSMVAVFDLIRQVAPSSATVLITGESGAGKELVARAIHYASPRAGKRFLSLNCAALAENLLDSELFGHEKGAFTDAVAQKKGLFEAVDGGTIFLDEIAEIGQAMQVKLLRVVQEREIMRVGSTQPIPVDFRLLTATNRDLQDEVSKNRFRQDLYYRLNVIGIRVPPLRERRDDIPLLALHFFDRFRSQEGKRLSAIGPDAMKALASYDWPGNVRELANVIERAVILCRGDQIVPDDLPSTLCQASSEPPGDLHTLDDHEREYIFHVVSRLDGNLTRASRVLGLDRTTLWRKLKKYEAKEGE